MSLRPDLTVAAIVEREGQFLFVEERVGNRMVFNQPAGHVERDEGLIDAVVRETLEETAWTFIPEAVTGIYLWDQPEQQRSFLRFTFCGHVTDHHPHRPLDRGIERAMWMTREQIGARSSRLRSPMVLTCIDDYLAGRRFDLRLLNSVPGNVASAAVTEHRPAANTTLTIDELS